VLAKPGGIRPQPGGLFHLTGAHAAVNCAGCHRTVALPTHPPLLFSCQYSEPSMVFRTEPPAGSVRPQLHCPVIQINAWKPATDRSCGSRFRADGSACHGELCGLSCNGRFAIHRRTATLSCGELQRRAKIPITSRDNTTMTARFCHTVKCMDARASRSQPIPVPLAGCACERCLAVMP